MSAAARAEAYDRHTGRYGRELSAAFVRFAGIEPGMRVLDVGCGTGALTARLAHIVGGDRVLAVDPSEAYAQACRRAGARRRGPRRLRRGAAVRRRRLRRRARPARDPGARRRAGGRARDAPRRRAGRRRWRRACGTSAAGCRCWTPTGRRSGPWTPMAPATPATTAPTRGARRDGLRRLWEGAGIADVETAELPAGADYDGFDDAWFSFAAGAGFSGAYCRSLDDGGARRCARSSAAASAPPTAVPARGRAWAVGAAVGHG